MKLSNKTFGLIFLIIFVLIEKSVSENITMGKISLQDNKPFVFHKFIYNNETKSKRLPNAGFEYLLTLSSKHHEEDETKGMLYIYLFDTDIMSSFSKLKCGQNATESVLYDKGKEGIKPLSTEEIWLHHGEVEVNKGLTPFNDIIDIEFSGVSKTVFLYCSYNNTNTTRMRLAVNGTFSYYNKNGFGSAEDFYLINLYFILTGYYALTSIYWVMKMVLNYKMISIYMTLFSIAIPFVIVENIFRLEFFSIIRSQGTLSLSFKLLAIIFRVIKNSIFRFVFFLLSYQFYRTVPLKGKVTFFPLLVLYVAAAVLYEIIGMKHDYYALPFIYFISSEVAFEIVNGGIMFILYDQFKSVANESRIKASPELRQETLLFANIIKYSMVVTIAHFVLYLLLRSLQDQFALCYLKWIVDLIQQSVSITIFSVLLFMIKGKNPLHSGYIEEIQLEKVEVNTQPKLP